MPDVTHFLLLGIRQVQLGISYLLLSKRLINQLGPPRGNSVGKKCKIDK